MANTTPVSGHRSSTRAEYKDIPDWPGMYKVSRDGKVRTIAHRVTRCNGHHYRVRARELKASLHRSVTLSKPGLRIRQPTHVLARQAWGAEALSFTAIRDLARRTDDV